MANNLHVSYDLYQPGQNYDAVIKAVKGLGSWAKIHQSYWYVDSNLTAEQAIARVWQVMDANDSLYIVDASSNLAAWQNLNDEAAKFIRDHWLA